MRTRWVLIVAPALILIFWLQMLHAIAGESLTWDEGDHIFAGYESWKTHDFGLNPEHPPMVKLIGTLPLLPLDLKVPTVGHRFFKAEAYLGGRELLFRNGPADGDRDAGRSSAAAARSRGASAAADALQQHREIGRASCRERVSSPV